MPLVGGVVGCALACGVFGEDGGAEAALVLCAVAALACGAPLAVGCCSMLGAV